MRGDISHFMRAGIFVSTSAGLISAVLNRPQAKVWQKNAVQQLNSFCEYLFAH